MRSLPFDEWPENDRQAWLTALAGDPFNGSCRMADWSVATREQARKCYGRLLSFLWSEGALDPKVSPGRRLDEDRLRQYVRWELDRLAPQTLSNTLSLITMVLAVIDPDCDLTCLREATAWAKRRAHREIKVRPRTVDAGALVSLGWTLMREALDQAPDVVDCEKYLDGLIVALLAWAPIRIRNFSTLELGDSFRRTGMDWRIELEASETKTRRADSWTLPTEATPWIDLYVERVRPSFGAPTDCGPLWFGPRHKPIGQQTLRKRIKQRTREAFGFPIRPHTFRHCAVTTFVEAVPDQAANAPHVLGHASAQTTERHYLVGERVLAVRRFQQILRQHRSAARSSRHRESVG